MNKSKIVKNVLKFRYCHSKKAVFLLKNESMVSVAQSVLSAIDKFNKSVSPHDFEIIRVNDRRLILRTASPEFPERSFVIKVSPLNCFKHRLQYHMIKDRRFGFGEVPNLIIAAKKGLNVPKVYGYGHIYGSCWLIKSCIVILENLANYTSVLELLELNRGNGKKCARILEWTIPTFVKFYKAKCNNIEINLYSIMLSNEHPEQDCFVLDFEHAKFHKKPSIEILMFEAASFVKWRPDLLTEQAINHWLAKLLDAVEIKDNTERRNLVERFNYYCVTKLHRKERREIY